MGEDLERRYIQMHHLEIVSAGTIITSTGGSAAHGWITKQIKTRGQTVTFRMTFKKIDQADWEHLAK